MKKIFLIIFLIQIHHTAITQVHKTDSPLAYTFSIVVSDAVTGEMGVAVQLLYIWKSKFTL